MTASKCKYMLAWSGPCCAEVKTGSHCARHSGIACKSCGAPADGECSHTGQFVCGAPLCDQCEGFVDSTQPSGNWGFLNHSLSSAKICPFCGGRNLRADADALENDGTGIVASIACDDCGDMQGPMSEFKYDDEAEAVADAIKQWNRRAT